MKIKKLPERKIGEKKSKIGSSLGTADIVGTSSTAGNSGTGGTSGTAGTIVVLLVLVLYSGTAGISAWYGGY